MNDESTASRPEDPERLLFGLPLRTVAMVTFIALVAAVAAGLLVYLSADDSASTVGNVTLDPAEDMVGSPAAVSYLTFDGEPRNTGDYVGQPLVLNFFAEWCPPCIAEMPDFEAVYQEVRGEVAFLGLNLQESSESGLRIVEQTGVTYDLGRDSDGSAFAAFGAVGMPTTVFIDSAGTIVEVHTGALTADQLRDRIDRLLR